MPQKKSSRASGVRNSPQHQTASQLSEASSRGHQLEQAVLQELIIAEFFFGKFSQWDVKGDVKGCWDRLVPMEIGHYHVDGIRNPAIKPPVGWCENQVSWPDF